jgi:transposase
LNIPRSTIKSIIKKWKEYGTTTNLPREGHRPKLTDQERRALIREATKRAKIILKELQHFTVERVSVHMNTLSCTLHRAGLYERVARKKSHCLMKKISKHVWCTKGM